MSNYAGGDVFGALKQVSTLKRWMPSIPVRIYSYQKLIWRVLLTKDPSDSLKDPALLMCTLMFSASFFSSCCSPRPLNVVSLMCAHCSVDSLARTNVATALMSWLCITHCLALPVPVPFCCSLAHYWQQTGLPTVRAGLFFFYVVRARTSITYSGRLPDVSFWSSACRVGVACHRALVSPQWLTTLSRRQPTDCCWLTNQQLSTTNLCCGPSRLTAFCVTIIELNRW